MKPSWILTLPETKISHTKSIPITKKATGNGLFDLLILCKLVRNVLLSIMLAFIYFEQFTPVKYLLFE